jgi:hypothetical protein
MSVERRLRQAKRQQVGELSAAERKVNAILQKIPKVLLHPLVGIGIAALIGFSGRSELALRSYGTLAFALWLTVDLWSWLLPKKDSVGLKYAFGFTLTSAMLIGVMAVMWWWLDGQLEGEREEVFQNLSASYQLIPAAKPEYDPMFTVFTVTNGSHQLLSGKHALVCYVNLAVGDHGTSGLENTWEATEGNRRFWGLGFVDEYRAAMPLLEPVQPGGDTHSSACLQTLGFTDGTECVDVTLMFWYSLNDQPNFQQEKDFRFVAQRDFRSTDNNKEPFIWSRKSLNSPPDYCRIFQEKKAAATGSH